MLGVRLPEELGRRLSALSLKTNRPKSFYVKEALSSYLDDYESVYEVVSQYEEQKKKGTLVTYTLEEIEKRHGLDA